MSFCQLWSDFISFSSVATVDFEQVYDGWEVTSDPKNLSSLLLENVVSQSWADFYYEAKKLQI